MTGSRGRPATGKIALKVRLTPQLVAELKTKHPELLKPFTSEWRHGAVSAYFERLLWKELRRRPHES